MATMILTAAGQAVGGALGGPLGAFVGASLGRWVGGRIDQAVFGDDRDTPAPLDDLSVQVSTYGKPIPLLYGGRVAGNVIWSTDKRHVRREVDAGGKGGGGGGGSQVEHHYYVTLAVSLGEGPIAGVRRVWADGELIHDPFVIGGARLDMTVHLGTPDQEPDDEIESREGVGNVPAYRHQAYVVIRDLHLNPHGYRIPNLEFEVMGRLTAGWGEDLAQGLARGPDGDIWLAANLRRTISRFDGRDYTLKAVIGRDDGNAGDYLGSLPAQPWRLCLEPVSGHLFATAWCDAKVLRIDPAGNAVVAEIDVDPYPHDIVADGLGRVWVSHPFGDSLTRIDAGDNAVAAVALAGEPCHLALGGDGRLWIAGTREIIHFDPGAMAELARVDLAAGGRFLPGGLAWNPADGKVWFACSGNDVVGILDPADYGLSWRNSGTWPYDAACNLSDDRATVFVSLLFGNRVKLLRRGRDYALDEFFEVKTEVWPGPLLALADGRCLVANMNRPFFQEIEGP